MFAALRIAFQTLAANKLRSSLTMLGNIIGVMSVVALVNIGISGREKMSQSLSSIGQNLIFVFPRYDPDADAADRWHPLNLDDVRAVQNGCPSAGGVTPIQDVGAKVTFGNQHVGTNCVGVWPSYIQIRNWNVENGTAFTEADLRAGSKVCIIGKRVCTDLFGNLDPIGQTIRINQQPFKVLGVLEEKGVFLTGQDQDNIILAPISAVMQRLTGGKNIKLIWVSARMREDTEKLKLEVRAAVRESHRLPIGRRDDVETHDMGQISSMVDGVVLAATALLSAIALISLLVGGIGIMNIMLVSVTERTREIGLRMAVGATGFAILLQFLVEAVVLSALGGMIGVCVGIGLSTAASAIFKWPSSLSAMSVVVALVFSAGVGVFFGLYPAWRASQLDPIVALRHE